jgi:ribosome-binding protein aMBF1 (putative translation factor)
MDDFVRMKKRLLKNPKFKKLHAETRSEFEIARMVIRARIKRGLTQKQLADKLHTRQSVISRVEGANTTPSLSFLKRLAVALNTTLQVQFK